ncbi:TetR/AcrR family transcriptional regulator [Haloechinothrix sp. LS1_15]|uniref:TetR/AcrR family transcriptional regulator n=1 Tax=Haloechinothrix sp. LS1_15 TaxID=2652248 RepID=UPI0029453CFF|nr:TetR/AcrR family transcriptional regulator [Haloechinothrix sp. LS1_15]MDV6012208.1 TetR/AcrR family transcriptional regulator [Haloechinothrix sp. LS1_15]
MPRPRTPAGELTPAASRVLTAAGELFYRYGINAVGVEAIADAAGVTKKTLYDRFGSKDELITAYLRERDRRWRDWLTGFVEEHATTPTDALLVTFDALAEWLSQVSSRGCAFVNAYAELAESSHPGHAAIIEQKRWLRDYLASLALDSGHDDPERIAENLLLLHDGVAVAQPVGVVTHAVEHAKQLAVCVLSGGRQARRPNFPPPHRLTPP